MKHQTTRMRRAQSGGVEEAKRGGETDEVRGEREGGRSGSHHCSIVGESSSHHLESY